MAETYDLNRLFWHSRRGMLELDLLLVPFVKEAFNDLADDDKKRYVDLLACEDQDLFAWLLQRSEPANSDHAKIVQRILEYNQRAATC